jgi:hypothetical protein
VTVSASTLTDADHAAFKQAFTDEVVASFVSTDSG